MEPVESFTLNEGYDVYGTHKQVTFEGDQVVTKLTYDAKPFIEQAKEERHITAGDRWGDGKKVGTIPMAVYAEYLKIQGAEERKKYILRWLKENPAFVTFEKFLK